MMTPATGDAAHRARARVDAGVHDDDTAGMCDETENAREEALAP
jgi:hypothetical protein